MVWFHEGLRDTAPKPLKTSNPGSLEQITIQSCQTFISDPEKDKKTLSEGIGQTGSNHTVLKDHSKRGP